MPHAFPCLYCGDVERPRTEEHVLQQAFGTALVLKDDVCGRCNTEIFSAYDTELVSHVRTLARPNHPGAAGNKHLLQTGHSISLDPTTGAWFSVRRRKQGGYLPLRQLALLDQNRAIAIPDEQVISAVRADMARNSELRISTVVAGARLGAHPSLIWSSPQCYAARASTQEAADALATALRNGSVLHDSLTIETSPDTISGREVQVTLEFHTNYAKLQRAVAKSAINFACAAAGAEFARRPEFATLRDFVLGEQPELSGLVHVERFGEMDVQVGSAADSFCLEGHHTMVLVDHGARANVLITLYGEKFAIVQLNSQPSAVTGQPRVLACIFNYSKQTHRMCSSQDGSFQAEFDQVPQTPQGPG